MPARSTFPYRLSPSSPCLRCPQALYLKDHFGTGYHLTVTKTATFQLNALIKLVQRHVANAQLLTETAEEASIKLPGAPNSCGYFPNPSPHSLPHTHRAGMTVVEQTP